MSNGKTYRAPEYGFGNSWADSGDLEEGELMFLLRSALVRLNYAQREEDPSAAGWGHCLPNGRKGQLRAWAVDFVEACFQLSNIDLIVIEEICHALGFMHAGDLVHSNDWYKFFCCTIDEDVFWWFWEPERKSWPRIKENILIFLRSLF